MTYNSSCYELNTKLIDKKTFIRRSNNGEIVSLKSDRNNELCIGKGMLVKVNLSLGYNIEQNISEVNSVFDKLNEYLLHPDMMMDLSTVTCKQPLYIKLINSFKGPVGTLPHYYCYKDNSGIDKTLLLEEIIKHCESGVSFITIHPTADYNLFNKALQLRKIPITSRGGSIVLHDMYINNRHQNIYLSIYSEILEILKKHNVALSIGTTFRPASVNDCFDEVHLSELKKQKEIIDIAKSYGVGTILETVGHAPLGKLMIMKTKVKDVFKVPIMPLGPIVTDTAIGYDHISNAVGSSYLTFIGAADVINSITPQEHTGGLPTLKSIIDGLITARLCAHSVNISKFPILTEQDNQIASLRGIMNSCNIYNMKHTTCNRCASMCPLYITNKIINTYL